MEKINHYTTGKDLPIAIVQNKYRTINERDNYSYYYMDTVLRNITENTVAVFKIIPKQSKN